jgi:hypothetical protein
MNEGEAAAMERQATKPMAFAKEAIVFALSISHVADDRVGDVFEMASQLVHASRRGFRLVEPVASGGGEKPKVASSRPLLAPLFFGQGMVHHAELLSSAAQGDVGLVDGTLTKKCLHVASNLRREREEQYAARRPVEAVYRIDEPSDLITEALNRRLLVVSPSAMHQQAGWFVNRDQVLVRVENRKRSRGIMGRARIRASRSGLAAGRARSCDQSIEERFEFGLHGGRLQNTHGACDRFEGSESERMGLATKTPPSRWTGRQRDGLRSVESRNAFARPARLAPVAVRYHQGYRARVLLDEAATEHRRAFPWEEQEHTPTFFVKVVEVKALIAQAVHVEATVCKGGQREGTGRARLGDFAMMHDQGEMGRQRLGHDVRTKTMANVHSTALAARRSFVSLSQSASTLAFSASAHTRYVVAPLWARFACGPPQPALRKLASAVWPKTTSRSGFLMAEDDEGEPKQTKPRRRRPWVSHVGPPVQMPESLHPADLRRVLTSNRLIGNKPVNPLCMLSLPDDE